MIHTSRRFVRPVVLVPLALALSIASAQAATRVDLHGQDVAQLNQQYKAATLSVGAPSDSKVRHAEMLGLEANASLQVLSTGKDENGTTHYRYQQTYRGVPIFGEHVVVSEDQRGAVRNLFGRAVGGLDLELGARVAAGLTSEQALSIGKTLVLGDAAVAKSGGMHVEREEARKMIFIDDNGVAHLSYVVSFFADAVNGGAPTSPVIIVDAQSGAILKQWDGLTTAQIGTGPGGNSKTGKYEWGSGGRFGFLDVAQSGSTCTMNNANVKTVNLNGSTGTSTTAFAYTCPRNTFKAINGGFAPINDAHFFGGVVHNMYQTYLFVNPLNFQMVLRVHYGSNYANGFWDGDSAQFGDGGTNYYPMVSIDWVGHEVSHGFTRQHSNLISSSGQSGGMNEAFSDMAGEAAEYYWKGSNDFMVFADTVKGSGASRYMNNPPQDGRSIDNAANFTSGMDAHHSSGVYNKAFWKLATTTGWNTRKAFRLFGRANQWYWTPSSNFNTGACGVQTAAEDFGYNVANVISAFAAVGVTCPIAPPPPGGISNGVAVTGLAATTGNSVNGTMVVPAGASNVKFVMTGGTGNADLYIKFGSAPTDSVYDCRPRLNGNAETCTMTARAGTYYGRIKAVSTFSGVSLTGSYVGPIFQNNSLLVIRDLTVTHSPITVTSIAGNAPSTLKVSVDITHTSTRDLTVDLVAPDGSLYAIHSLGFSANNVIKKTVTINASSEFANGTWNLRVKDHVKNGHGGNLRSWSMQF